MAPLMATTSSLTGGVCGVQVTAASLQSQKSRRYTEFAESNLMNFHELSAFSVYKAPQHKGNPSELACGMITGQCLRHLKTS